MLVKPLADQDSVTLVVSEAAAKLLRAAGASNVGELGNLSWAKVRAAGLAPKEALGMVGALSKGGRTVTDGQPSELTVRVGGPSGVATIPITDFHFGVRSQALIDLVASSGLLFGRVGEQALDGDDLASEMSKNLSDQQSLTAYGRKTLWVAYDIRGLASQAWSDRAYSSGFYQNPRRAANVLAGANTPALLKATLEPSLLRAHVEIHDRYVERTGTNDFETTAERLNTFYSRVVEKTAEGLVQNGRRAEAELLRAQAEKYAGTYFAALTSPPQVAADAVIVRGYLRRSTTPERTVSAQEASLQ